MSRIKRELASLDRASRDLNQPIAYDAAGDEYEVALKAWVDAIMRGDEAAQREAVARRDAARDAMDLHAVATKKRRPSRRRHLPR